MYLETFKCDIKVNGCSEVKALELFFLIDGIQMTEDKMIDIIKDQLNKLAEGKTYKIILWLRQTHKLEQSIPK